MFFLAFFLDILVLEDDTETSVTNQPVLCNNPKISATPRRKPEISSNSNRD